MVEFDNPMMYVIAGVFYAIMMGLIWGLDSWGSIDLKTKLFITLVAYPICYIITESIGNK